jgi:hypothetical protein
MSNMLPSQAAPVTRVLLDSARSVSLCFPVWPRRLRAFLVGEVRSVCLAVVSIIGCRNVGPCKCCLSFAGVDAQIVEIVDPPFAVVRAQ